MNDEIKTYVTSIAAGVSSWCPTCNCQRAVWVGETQGGDTLTCCCVCQRVLKRRETASIPPLSANTPKGGPADLPALPQEPIRALIAKWRERIASYYRSAARSTNVGKLVAAEGFECMAADREECVADLEATLAALHLSEAPEEQK